LLLIALGAFLLWEQKQFDGVGSYLSGIGTLGLLLLAILQLPKELEKNRLQRREDKQSEVSYEMVEITIKYVNGIKHFINPLVFTHEQLPEDEGQNTSRHARFTNLVKVFRFRLKDREKDIQNFYDSGWKLRYLPNYLELNETYTQLRNLYFNLSVEINFLNSVEEDFEPNLVSEHYNNFYNLTSIEQIDALKETFINQLSVHF
jgi:hypothetical protein